MEDIGKSSYVECGEHSCLQTVFCYWIVCGRFTVFGKTGEGPLVDNPLSKENRF